jgi:hypothetical protein
MRWFIIAGCIGVIIAGGLTLARDHISPHMLTMLWPTSLIGMVFTESPKLTAASIILISIMYGGNFLLYGVVGAAARYLLKSRSKATM